MDLHKNILEHSIFLEKQCHISVERHLWQSHPPGHAQAELQAPTEAQQGFGQHCPAHQQEGTGTAGLSGTLGAAQEGQIPAGTMAAVLSRLVLETGTGCAAPTAAAGEGWRRNYKGSGD